MKLYFARHGESEANVRGIYSNRAGDAFPLTPNGIEQAQQLADTLRSTPFATIYSSPLLRAMQTARIAADALGLEPIMTPALIEYDTGILEGQVRTEYTDSLYAENERAWFVDRNFGHRIPGGESLRNIENRFVPFIDELKNEFQNQSNNILLIGHGGLYRAMLPMILRDITFEMSYQMHLRNCAFVVAGARGADLLCLEWPHAIAA